MAGGRLRNGDRDVLGDGLETFLSALIALIKALDEEAVSAIVFWVMGSFQGQAGSMLLFRSPICFWVYI